MEHAAASERFRKVRHFQGFFDVQFAWVAVGVDASVIVNAVGQIRIFLDFAEDHVRANGVRRARGNEKRVAGLHGVRLE